MLHEMVPVPAADPSEQELDLLTFFLSGEGANREAWASLAFLEKLSQLKDTLRWGTHAGGEYSTGIPLKKPPALASRGVTV